MIEWDWVSGNRAALVERLVEHLQLTGIAVAVGLAIAFPLAVIAYRRRAFYGPLTGFTGLLYTIPSLALFAFLVPYTGLTVLTAEIGLVSYTLLILIRNIVSGLDGVPEETKEAARGMGLSERQLLWQVEVPLALPVIFAGIRLATVTVIGLVTVTALITFGGFGALILEGIQRLFPTPAIVGGVLSLVLAAIVDQILIRVEHRLTPWARLRSLQGVS